MELQSVGTYSTESIASHLGGWSAARGRADGVHKRKVNEAARLYADVLQGRLDPVFLREAVFPRNEVFVMHLAERYPHLYGDPSGKMLGLRETMSVTDYQALYVDVLDRLYYGYYNAYPIVNKELVKIHPLRDFRAVSRYLLDGVVSPLTSMDPAAPPPQRALTGPVPQGGATASSASTAPIQYQPLLWQAMTSVNWRAFVNDDLGIFRDLSNRLAIAGNRGISKYITGLYMDVNGPNASLYKTAYHNQINTTNGAATNNPPFSAQGVADGFKVLASMVDSGGDPIMMGGKVYLWYGPSLYAAVKNFLAASTIQMSVEGGTVNAGNFPSMFINVNNWMTEIIPIMDPYIPIVCTTSGVKQTSWGMTVDPNTQDRPNCEVGFLNGFETPQIFTKVPNTARVGGGVDPMMGDFNTLDQDMKIVTVFAGTQIDGRSTVASNGSGS